MSATLRRSFSGLGLGLSLASASALAQGGGATPPAAPAAVQQEPARRQSLDKTVAIVGNKPILLSEVLENLNARRQQGMPFPPDSAGQVALMKQLVSEMIDDEVVIEVAKQYKAEAKDEDVAKQVDDRIADARKRFNSEAEFRDALRRDGFGTPEDYRRTIREQAKRYKMQQLGYDSLRAHGKLSAPVQVTEAEVNAAFEAAKGRLPKKPATVAFRQIVMMPRASDSARAKAVAKAEALVAEIKAGADFAAVAKRESMDPMSKELGGDLGWARRGVMVPEFDRAIFDPRVIPGVILPLVETSFGIHIIRVDRIQPAEVKARHILITPDVDSADVVRTRLLADSVLKRWQAGESFDSLSARYHDRAEERTIPEGIAVDSLPEVYKAAMEGVPAKGFTKPFDIPDPRSGRPKIAIIHVLERAEGGDFTVADYKDRIRTQLVQEKQIRRMLDQLRREQYVRVMLDEPRPTAAPKVVP
jgi:peptidyl-prolyl cis-trans isomerase SurA